MSSTIWSSSPRESRYIHRLSLRARLILLVVVSIVPLVAFMVGRRYVDYQDAIEKSAQKTLELSRGMSLAVEKELQARIGVLEVLALSRALQEGNLDAFRTQAERVVETLLPGSNILLLQQDGQQVLNTLLPQGAALPARKNLDTIRQVFATGRPAVSNVFEGLVTKRYVVSLDVPVRRRDGSIAYVLSTNPEVDAFASLLRRQHIPDSWVSSIFDRSGANVARTYQPSHFIGQKAGAALFGRMQAEREGTLISVSREGITLVTGFSRADRFGWTVSMGVPMSELREPAIIAGARALTAGLGALVLGLVLAIVLSKQVTGPMAALRRMAAGRDGPEALSPASTGLREADEVAEALSAAERGRRRSEAEVVERNHELEATNLALQSEIEVRRQAEQRAQAQLERLGLLHQITRAIGERQDLDSIFQVVVRSLEDQLPVDFACLCLYDAVDHVLTVARVGAKSGALSLALAMPERAQVEIDENGLSRCVRGQLVYEPDITSIAFPFPQRLAAGGLRSLVAAPLQVESQVFGVLVAARLASESFSSGECEFLRQLSEHVALAAHQAQLHGALQRAYDDLRQTQQAVMQQERLRALGQMASGIAHDINNALSPVALYTESLLEREPALSSRTRGYLETIQRAVEDVSHTVARMREFYRQREPQLLLVPVSLNPLVRQVVDLTRARWSDMALQRGTVIDVRMDLAADLPPILAVESEIREALINLVLNAVDAVPQGGTIELRTRVLDSDSAYRPSSVVIEVSDDGVGMDAETRRRCLEPFFSTKGERGTGLGLAMVYGVAQRHAGEIEIDSSPGQGTTVRLRFATPDSPEPASTDSPPAPVVPSRLRLLLVDDDPLILKSLSEILEAEGHVVSTSNDGAAGIAAFRLGKERGHIVDAVITDLGMPKIDGRRVAAAIKAASPETPVILLTGWGQRLLSEDSVPPHVDRVLSKPPKIRELREAFAHLCSRTTS